MPYDEFVATKYWDIVQGYVLRKRRYRCELCDATKDLAVHHRTYDRRGEEYRHLEDLAVLCPACRARSPDRFPAPPA